MTTREIVGWVTVAIGVALVYTSYRERREIPPWVPQVAVAVLALGLGSLAATRETVPWSIVSSAFSLVAIVLLLRVIRGSFRSRR